MLQRCCRSAWRASAPCTRLPRCLPPPLNSSHVLLLQVRPFSSPSPSSLIRPPSKKRKAVASSTPIQPSQAPPPSPPPAPPQPSPASAYEVDEATGAVLVELKSDGDTESEAEREAIWSPLREALDREGSVVTAEGEEIVSIAEMERRLQEEGLDTANAVEDEGEDEGEGEEEEGEEGEEGEEENLPPSPSLPIRSRRSSPSNTLWVQERGDGSVSITPWPFNDSDPLPDPYEAPPPRTPSSLSSTPLAVVGSSIGGEKVRVVDVLQLHERDLQEHFSKGGGKGGQKVNKTSNCVHLHHVPTGTIVKCHATRSLADNRRIARSIMKGRLEELLLGPASSNRQRQQKIKKSKAKARKRTKEKYGEEVTRTPSDVEPPLPLAMDSPTRVVELQLAETTPAPTIDAGVVTAKSRPVSALPAVKALRRRQPAALSAVEVE